MMTPQFVAHVQYGGMFRHIRTAIRLVSALCCLVGFIYLPADIMTLPDAYPPLRRINDVSRETLLIYFSGILVVYLFFMELRPYVQNWREKRAWLPLEAACQLLYENLKYNDNIAGLVRNSHYDRPVAAIMSNWLGDGLQRGIIRAYGKRLYSEQSERIPANVLISTEPPYSETNEIFARSMDDDTTWTALVFRRRELNAYLDDLEADRINRYNAQTM